MKKILFLFLSTLLIIGCSNDPQSKAEKAVKSHLKQTVEGYQPVSFGELYTIQLETEPDYKMAKDSLEYNMSELRKTSDQFVLAAHQQAAKKFKIIVAELEEFYKNKKYRINHKYSGQNGEKDQDFYLTSYFDVVE